MGIQYNPNITYLIQLVEDHVPGPDQIADNVLHQPIVAFHVLCMSRHQLRSRVLLDCYTAISYGFHSCLTTLQTPVRSHKAWIGV